MLFNNRDQRNRSRTTSVDSGIERVVEDICSRFGVTGKGSSIALQKAEFEAKANKSTFFGSRARNDTINSTSSSVQSLPSTAGTDQSSCRSSFDEKSYNPDYPFLSNDQRPKTRYGMTRGAKLTRESSKVSLVSTLSRVEETKDERAAHGAAHSTGETDSRANEDTGLKRFISSPFGFQHVAHVKRQHSSPSKSFGNESLSVSFAAKQMGQHSKEGPRKVQSQAALQDALAPIAFKGHMITPQKQSDTNISNTSPIKQVRSADFSAPLSHKAVTRKPIKFSNGITPPPRSSSRNAIAHMNLSNSATDDDVITETYQTHTRDNSAIGNDWIYNYSEMKDNPQLYPDAIMTSVPRIMDLPHAVTTPDESAVPAISPSYSLDLEDVPEEEVGYFRRLSDIISQFPLSGSSISPQKSMKTLQSWGSQSTVSDSVSSPCSPVQDQTPGRWNQTRPALTTSFGLSNTKRLSHRFDELDCSWEDDVDFCYEHAAEADCDFDWQSPIDEQNYVKSETVIGTPSKSFLRTSQITDVDQPSMNKPEKGIGHLWIKRNSSGELQPQPELILDTQIPLLTHRGSSPMNGSNEALSSHITKGTDKENSLSLGCNAEQPKSPLLATNFIDVPLVDITVPSPNLENAEKNILPLQTHGTRMSEDSLLGLNKAAVRLSRSSSFESIIKPYSELPNSLRSSKNSFDYVIDLATGRYGKTG